MKNGRKGQARPSRIELGQYIVVDTAICHGKVTFKETRIFVADVLADVQAGLSRDFIIRRWSGGKITKAAIAEAMRLAHPFWLDEDRHLTTRSAKAA